MKLISHVCFAQYILTLLRNKVNGQRGGIFSSNKAYKSYATKDVESGIGFASRPDLMKVTKPKGGKDLDEASVQVIPTFTMKSVMEPSQESAVQKDGALDEEIKESKLQPEFVFEGLSNLDNLLNIGKRVLPPDTVGDVGFKYYIQAVNLMFSVFEKNSGKIVVGPLPLGILWSYDNAPSDCSLINGDPNVIYDQFERAFLISQFTYSCDTPDTQCYQCVAVLPEDTLLDSYIYFWLSSTSPISFGDYPRMGMFGDSYVITTNDYDVISEVFQWNTIYLIERKPLYALELNFVVFSNINPTGDYGVLLPADNDGALETPLSPAIPFMAFVYEPYSNSFKPGLRVFEALVDYGSGTGTFTEVSFLPVANYQFFKCFPTYLNCIPQPGATKNQYVDGLGDRLMHQLAYQNYGKYESMVAVHSVLARLDSEGNNVAGSRWYEIRRQVDSSGNRIYSVFQESTFAPEDSTSRWMGSIAQDKNGNIALGYSVSSASNVFPGIRYTGRLSNDEPSTMTLGEGIIVDGSSIQKETDFKARWGDYSSMNVDPEDFCTFYYTTQYYAPDSFCEMYSDSCWKTKIARFKFPGCANAK